MQRGKILVDFFFLCISKIHLFWEFGVWLLTVLNVYQKGGSTYLIILHINYTTPPFPGTISFLRSISLAAIGLGVVHLSAGAHEILLQAEYILTTIPPSVPWPVQSRVNSNVRSSNQPKDAQQGIQQVGISTPLNFTQVLVLTFVKVDMKTK